MAQINFLKRGLLFLLLASSISGCAEVRAMFTVLFQNTGSLSTSSFEFDEIRSGSRLTCSILGDKTVRCLGNGEKGNLGTFHGGATLVEGPVKLLATGDGFTCVVAGPKSKLQCFGRNDRGQLGNTAPGSSLKPVPVKDLDHDGAEITDVKELSAGNQHACALLAGGRAVCWGDNSFGQLGAGTNESYGARDVREGEKNAKPLAAVKSIVAGSDSTCVIVKDDGLVMCFGERYGSSKQVNPVPERIEVNGTSGFLLGARQVGVGKGFGCALTKNSQVWCWGKNDRNQLGLPASSPGLTKAAMVEVPYPQQVALSRVDQIAVADFHACAIHRDERTVYCWGRNDSFQLGNNSSRGTAEQVAVGSNNLTLKGVKEVRAGPDRSCIISLRDELFCWGNGVNGILGNPKVSSIYPMVAKDANREVLQGAARISVGADHTCFIDQREKLYCFGMNLWGQLGTNLIAAPAITPDEKKIEKVASIDVQGSRVCVIHGEKQSVGCFGGREPDPTGQRPKVNTFILDEIRKNGGPVEGVQGVALGSASLCVIESNQTVSCLPRTDVTQPPVTVSEGPGRPLRDIWQIRTRGQQMCALSQEAGAVYCWGQETLKQAENAVQLTSQGAPSKDFIQISVDSEQVCGVQGSERQLFCTSLTDPAKRNDLAPVSSPEGEPLKGVVVLTGGLHHFCAGTEGNRLYCWGKNDAGQFGIKSPLESPVPLRIELTNLPKLHLSRVTAGDRHTCVSGDGETSLYCFGESFFNGTNSTDPLEYPL
ncbi:MAG: hypothetical protein EBX52_02085 [Proteobacteria bacterium]|nr:hypothetical protein [Pseudomonadota bacterium]